MEMHATNMAAYMELVGYDDSLCLSVARGAAHAKQQQPPATVILSQKNYSYKQQFPIITELIRNLFSWNSVTIAEISILFQKKITT